MQRILVGLAAAASLVATALLPASAQSIPPGSYQQSCTNIHVRGDQLIARCNLPRGGTVRSTLSLDSCRRGDIANVNGQLTCNRNGNGYGRGHNGNGNGDGNGNGNGNNGNGNGNNGNGYGYGRGYGMPGGSYQELHRSADERLDADGHVHGAERQPHHVDDRRVAMPRWRHREHQRPPSLPLTAVSG